MRLFSLLSSLSSLHLFAFGNHHFSQRNEEPSRAMCGSVAWRRRVEWHKNCAKKMFIKSECALEGKKFSSSSSSLHLFIIHCCPLFSLPRAALHLKILIARGALFISHLFYFYFFLNSRLDLTRPCVGKISKDRSAQQKKEKERIAENPRLLLIPFDSC